MQNETIYNKNKLQKYRCVSLCVSFLLWSETHAEAGQVSITEGEDDHEEDEPAVMMEEDGQVETRLNITQHEERDEDEAAHDGHRK